MFLSVIMLGNLIAAMLAFFAAIRNINFSKWDQDERNDQKDTID